MSAIVPFESAKLPSYLQSVIPVSDDLGGGGVTFPVISIKGKIFTIKRGDEKTIVTKPGEDDPAGSIEVVIIKAFPSGTAVAKTFYSEGYSEGSDAKPTCYSDDGIEPANDAADKQSNKCALCQHNQAGSAPTATNPKGRACASSRKLAVAQVGAVGDPMLLRVPAASLKALREFGDVVKKCGYSYQSVVTKIGFDYTVAHPALTFRPVGFVDEATYAEVAEMTSSDLVGHIVGAIPWDAATAVIPAEEEFETPKPAPVVKPVVKAAPKPAPKPAPVAEDDNLPTKPVAKIKVEGEPAPKPAIKAVPKPAPKPAVVEVEDAEEGLDSMLDEGDFNFDD